MKLIITSIDAIIDLKTGEYFKGIKKALDLFESYHKGNQVVIISNHQDRLDKIPDDFEKFHLGKKWLRSSPKLIEMISEASGLEYNDIYILGGKDDDFILAANAKVVLLTADYSKTNNPTARLFSEGYGIGILSAARLTNFFNHFLDLDEPWFYSLDIDKDCKLYGLTDAMTRKQTDNQVRVICEKLKAFLKDGSVAHKNPFLIYALMSVHQIFKDAEYVNYWGYYPSSTTAANPELKNLKEILRKSFKSNMTEDDIFVRTKNSPQRKRMSEHDRIADGCDSQFDSMIINPWFRNKLRGKNVCIIDDFTNHGSSSETARHLLKAAGVKKIIFITLGKFREDYKMFDYTLTGDVYSKYTYKKNGTYKTLRGKINNKSSRELLSSLKELLD